MRGQHRGNMPLSEEEKDARLRRALAEELVGIGRYLREQKALKAAQTEQQTAEARP